MYLLLVVAAVVVAEVLLQLAVVELVAQMLMHLAVVERRPGAPAAGR